MPDPVQTAEGADAAPSAASAGSLHPPGATYQSSQSLLLRPRKNAPTEPPDRATADVDCAVVYGGRSRTLRKSLSTLSVAPPKVCVTLPLNWCIRLSPGQCPSNIPPPVVDAGPFHSASKITSGIANLRPEYCLSRSTIPESALLYTREVSPSRCR